ncbi:MAG: 2Fe-2S iron-sulfur cluster-binding protein, partial [Gammaproteobacteria bacterium]
MGFRVELEGTGRSFVCQEGESILDEGLRAGLPLDYGCTAGSCGDCRARLISGNTKPLARGEYPFSEADRGQGWMLPCVHTAASDLVLYFPDLMFDGEVPEQRLSTRVSKIQSAGDSVRVVHLKTSRAHSFRFIAGQRVAVTFPGFHRREYSIASCPCNGREIQIHQCRLPDDPLSDAVFRHLRVGESIEIEGPYGQFRFDDDSASEPQLFIAMGTGFAAIQSVVEHSLALDTGAPMHLFWIGAGEAGHYRQNQCRVWRDAFENFGFELARLGGDQAKACEFGHAVSIEAFEGMLRPLAEDWERLDQASVYVSGPAELIGAAKRLFQRHPAHE